MPHLSIRSALATVYQLPLRPALPPRMPFPSRSKILSQTRVPQPQQASFTTSAPLLAKKRGKRPERRITNIRHFLYHPTTLTPRPLRLSRNRALRHWTIVRAWRLFQSQLRIRRERELEAQYNAMSAACEDLRTGVGDGGKLFRRAMMKTGTWGIRDPSRGKEGREAGVPIEYARGLSEWVGSVGGLGRREGREVWDENWKRW